MNARRLLLCSAVSLLACSCSTLKPSAPRATSPAERFEASISRIEQTDPGSPTLLNAQLAYAGFLLSGAQGPSCQDHLNHAQEEIGGVASNPETRVLFPAGWPLLADLEYRQHLARAACAGKADRKDELLAAVDAAHRAVGLYRDAFDYHAMVVMQFNTAIALNRLGESGAALAALETALRMDREFGFADDARENYELLLTWRGEPAGAAQVAALMRDFPQRRATFKFGWGPSDARITFDRRRVSLSGGWIARSHAVAGFERRISAGRDGGWKVSYSQRLAGYEPGVWPYERVSQSVPGPRTPQLVFAPAPLPALDFKVSRKGEFEGATDSEAFATRLTAETDKLIRARTPAGSDGRSAADDAIETTAIALSPGMLEAATAESYQLETAMWIGATLEQGVWYEISAPLSLPGISRFVVPHRIDFAFTRMVPCTHGAAAEGCVEIVLHVTPDGQALHNLLADVGDAFPSDRLLNYAAATDARIVLDPATLRSYSREERIYWYASLSKHAEDEVLESEHLVSTTKYDAAAGSPAAASQVSIQSGGSCARRNATVASSICPRVSPRESQ